jgi:Holliday junction DNA helicase RuvA
MIATLTGKVLIKGLDRVVIDVSGVGYEVFLTTDALTRLPDSSEEIFLHIYTQVREDAIVLYGFLETEDKEMFLYLTSVSGIGPKLGLAALSGMRVAELCRAIAAGDIKLLTSLQGVGKKTAERICVELKDKVGDLAAGGDLVETAGDVAPGASSAVADVLSALGNLGYSDPVSRKSLTAVKRRLGDEAFYGLSVEELLRECLRSLA